MPSSKTLIRTVSCTPCATHVVERNLSRCLHTKRMRPPNCLFPSSPLALVAEHLSVLQMPSRWDMSFHFPLIVVAIGSCRCNLRFRDQSPEQTLVTSKQISQHPHCRQLSRSRDRKRKCQLPCNVIRAMSRGGFFSSD